MLAKAKAENRSECCQAPKPPNSNKLKEIELAGYIPKATKIEQREKLRANSQ
jgi:hypothetical protein